jgi:hypothetical protein
MPDGLWHDVLNSSTYRQRRTAKARIRSNIAPSILGQALQEFGLEREGIGDRNDFTGANTARTSLMRSSPCPRVTERFSNPSAVRTNKTWPLPMV